jgi:CheY-like chemotaxis protein
MINKCCIIICISSDDQALFISALQDVSPNTICFSVCDPSDALYIIRDELLVPDIVFIENQMPGMDALEFLRTARGMAELKDTSIIVHALSLKPHILLELKALGALAIYQRPYEYNGIRNMLTLFLEDELGVTNQN